MTSYQERRLNQIREMANQDPDNFYQLTDKQSYSIREERYWDEYERTRYRLVLYVQLLGGKLGPVMVSERNDEHGRKQLWKHVDDCAALRGE